MEEQKYYGLTAEEVDNLYHAINFLDDVSGLISDKIVEIELAPNNERRSHRNEDRALNEAYKHIDYAIDYIRQSIRDLKKT